jgi:transposase
MGRYREYNPKQGFFSALNSEKIKASSPLLTIVDYFVETHLDVQVFEAKLKNQEGGAEAVHPKVLLKVLLYGFSTGVRSYRDIEDHLEWDPYFLVLSCQQKIDHTTLCKFILKYSEEFDDYLAKLMYVLEEMGLARQERVAIDGTKIEANASLRRFIGTPEDYRAKSIKLAQQIQQMKEDSQQQTDETDKTLRKLEESKEEIDRFMEDLKKRQIPHKETDRLHPVDVEARFVKEEQTTLLGYNAQIAVDGESHLIVAADVFNEASDSVLFQPMVEELPADPAEKHSQLLQDAGYFSSENIVYCEQNNLDAYIPEGKKVDGGKESGLETISSKDCQLENHGQIKILICPNGQRMESCKTSHAGHGKHYYYFWPDPSICATCPLKEKCLGKVKTKKRFRVKKEYMDSLHARQRMRTKLSTEQGKKIYRSRASTVEHVFGMIKEIFHFRRFHHRGLKKVKLIWRMICAAYNFRRLAVLGFSPS